METKKNFNPTVTALFTNAKFGEGGLLSAAIDAKGFAAVQQHLQIGSKLVVKKSARPNKNGDATYFLEILPPMGDNPNWKQNKTPAPVVSDEIG